jgi:cytochrome c oxidase subunit 3/cytochrome o ubiquinol oxidase subunit 3
LFLGVPLVSLLGTIIMILGFYGWAFEPASDPVHSDAGSATRRGGRPPAGDGRREERSLAPTAVELQTAHGSGGDIGHDHGHAEHPPSSTGHGQPEADHVGVPRLRHDVLRIPDRHLHHLPGRAEALGVGPFPFDIFDIPYTSVSAFVLLMSSLRWCSRWRASAGQPAGLRVWLLATALLGAIFVGGQYFEFTLFASEGLTLTSNMFGASFYVLTGFHGAHVTIGVIWLLTLVWMSLRGGISQENSMVVEVAGLYWHFVDIVWIVIFTLVYLIPYEEVAAGEGGPGGRGRDEPSRSIGGGAAVLER